MDLGAALLAVELVLAGVLFFFLPGDEGREFAGLPRFGVVAINGVAVQDGSTLAMGVISVPMSRIQTVRMLITSDSAKTDVSVEFGSALGSFVPSIFPTIFP